MTFAVSVSGDSCPACAEWENRLLSISGNTPGLPTVADAQEAGLLHPNCTHSFVAVGDSVRQRKYDEHGRPKEPKAVNSPERVQRNTHQARQDYIKLQAVRKTEKMIGYKKTREIDNYYNSLPKANKKALSNYTNSMQIPVNKALRGQIEMTDEIQREIQILSETLKGFPKFEGTVYRNVTFNNKEALDNFMEKLVNRPNDDFGFTSTSFSKSTFQRYDSKQSSDQGTINKYTVEFEYLNTKSGALIATKSEKPHDYEVLFDHKTKFKVLEFQDLGGKLRVVMNEL